VKPRLATWLIAAFFAFLGFSCGPGASLLAAQPAAIVWIDKCGDQSRQPQQQTPEVRLVRVAFPAPLPVRISAAARRDPASAFFDFTLFQRPPPPVPSFR
jgi:hypothetical protein